MTAKDPLNEERDAEAPGGEDRLPRNDERLRQRIDRLVPEVIRRTFYAGLGAVFTTEEGVRRLANEFSLPKDVANYLIQQAQGTKRELFRIVAAELRSFLESLNVNEELQRLLTTLSFEIKTEIRFIPNEARSSVRPQTKQSVKVRRKGGSEAEGEEKEKEDQEEPLPAEEPPPGGD